MKLISVFSVAAILLCLIAACVPFRDSPFSLDIETDLRNFNMSERSRVQNNLTSDDFKFAAITDSHQNYSDLEKTIKNINKRSDLDFAVSLGDFTNYGYGFEYDWYAERIKEFDIPFMSVAGNHDLISRGKELYKKIFGPYNFTVEFANTKIIFWNSNSLEMHPESLDYAFLEDELNDSAGITNLVVIWHLPSYQKGYFSASQDNEINTWMSNNNVDIVMNGHNNKWSTQSINGNLYHQVARVEGQNYSTFEFSGGALTIQQCTKSSCETVSP